MWTQQNTYDQTEQRNNKVLMEKSRLELDGILEEVRNEVQFYRQTDIDKEIESCCVDFMNLIFGNTVETEEFWE